MTRIQSLVITLCLGALAVSTAVAQEKYETVILGGLGVSFSDNVETVKRKGFFEMPNPRNIPSVGEWLKFSNKGEFFEQTSVMIAPISKYIYRIEGHKFYSGQTAFSNCQADQRAIQSQVKTKYPTLHENYHNAMNSIAKNRFSFSYHEGKMNLKHMGPMLIGRAISVDCYGFGDDKEENWVSLKITYREADEKQMGLFQEKEQVFKGLSGDMLKQKGLDPNKL